MSRLISTAYLCCLTAALLTAFSGTVQIGVCVCRDHLGTWTAAGQDECCDTARFGTGPASAESQDEDCASCMDIVLPSLHMPASQPPPAAKVLPAAVSGNACASGVLPAILHAHPQLHAPRALPRPPCQSGDLLRI